MKASKLIERSADSLVRAIRGRRFAQSNARKERTASRPRLAARSTATGLFGLPMPHPAACRGCCEPGTVRGPNTPIFARTGLSALLLLTGCRGAPSINLVGSFFPAWMLCAALGVIGVLLLRRLFVRIELEPHLGPVPLVYFCLWILLTLGTWLLFFRG